MIRSSPIPVSMDGFGSFVIDPSRDRSYCMKTRFQISRYRSQSQPTAQVGCLHPTFSPEIVDDLGARTAGPLVTHGPEIVLLAEPHDPRRGDAHPLPQLFSLVVLSEDGDPQAPLVQVEPFQKEIPRVGDRVFLEIVAEGEIAEHFEEGVVPERLSDVAQVVMLAPGPHALLRRRRPRVRPLLQAEKNVLELDHAGIDEQQAGVLLRH